MKHIDADRVRSVFDYDPATGVLTWKVKKAARTKIGDVAGSPSSSGYVAIHFDGKKMQGHRLAWAHYYGAEPSGIIDHIDGNRSNNSIINLRVADKSINSQNIKEAHRHSTSGLLGAHRVNGSSKWKARIVLNGKLIQLGRFDTAEEAHQAYLAKKREIHKGCTL